ncbi:major facilitator superfamily domain-containing protein [Chytridium lagenaria]|nr:major facilitator superfamily domain-containing protein [Chytridium lagenaria]
MPSRASSSSAPSPDETSPLLAPVPVPSSPLPPYQVKPSVPWYRRASPAIILPPVAMSLFALGLLIIPNQNLYLSIACRQVGIDPALDMAACRASPEANALTVTWQNNIGLASAIPALFSSLFTGVFMDKIGRKPFIVLNSIGSLLEVVTFFVLYMGAPITFAYVSSFLLGGRFFWNASRATIFAITDSLLVVSVLAAPFISGIFSTYFGSLLLPVMVAACLMVTGILWVIVLVPESLAAVTPPASLESTSETPKKKETMSMIHIVNDLVSAFTTLFQGPLFLVTLFILLNTTIAGGTAAYFLLFVSFKFGWGEAEQGTYLLFSALKRMLNLTFILPAVIRIFESTAKPTGTIRTVKERTRFELNLLLLATMIYGGGYSIIAMLTQGWQLYLVLGLESFASIISPVSRSLLSKAMPEKSQGRLMSSLSFLGIMFYYIGATILSYLWVTLYLCGVVAAINFIILSCVDYGQLSAQIEAIQVQNKKADADAAVLRDPEQVFPVKRTDSATTLTGED